MLDEPHVSDDAESQFHVDAPWSLNRDELEQALDVNADTGLSPEEAARRLELCGPNRIRETAVRGLASIVVAQFADLMILLLAVAAVVSAAIGEWHDALLIAAIVIANAIIGAAQELRAEKAVEALKELSQPDARVWRGGNLTEIPADEVVPGDVVELHGGDFVPADARPIEAVDLQSDEAPLTGESLEVDKTTSPIDADAVLPDRRSMLHAGTAVTRGRGRAIVVVTGMDTQVGHIAALIQETEHVQTPLQRRLASLSKRLALVVIVICVVIFIAGVVREPRSQWDGALFSRMLLTAVSLAVAAIPEGLPAVITIALALGSRRMVHRNAIVRKLAAVETLGSVDVICSDKTGTLTQNRMTVEDVIIPEEVASSNAEDARRELLLAGLLCNDAETDADEQAIGSATEVALLEAAIGHGIEYSKARSEHPRIDEIPFSSDRKRMSTLHRDPDGALRVYVKGAVEAILDRCTTQGFAGETPLDDARREQLQQQSAELAERGRRMLAVAVRDWDREELPSDDPAAESDLRLLGVVGIVDPARPEVGEAIKRCRTAGIRTVMITGDHKGTAKSIASELGIYHEGERIITGAELEQMDQAELERAAPETTIYARVAPEHKLRIVRAHQARDSVVSMTGDGVNDAPALKQADIGVAMGITGTDVSKEASEMVLADDNFATIVAAVEEGRTVYDNIRKCVQYLLTTNTGEVLTLFVSILLGMRLPLVPVHILWINLVTDGLPALALGFEPSETKTMNRPPRRRGESIFAGGMGWSILLFGSLMGVACVILFHVYMNGLIDLPASITGDEQRLEYSRTMVFLTLAMFQLFYVLSIRSHSESFLKGGLWANPRLTGAVLLGAAAQIAVIYVPVFQKFFHTVSLSPRDLAIGVATSCLAFVAYEIKKAVTP